uniref:Carboxylesterase type B domain-containing protein n=1 Tax=Trichogramma kaykai TaxID=54128 RepID=A0ABD2WDL1_9HYME
MRDNAQHECIVHSQTNRPSNYGEYSHNSSPEFANKSSTNVWGDWMGVMHGDEIEYVFGHPLNTSVEYTERERDLANRMIMIYSNFARHGPLMTYLSVRIESSFRERDEILSICQPRKIY